MFLSTLRCQVDIACRFVEHLLHIQHTNRSTADRTAGPLSELAALSALLGSLRLPSDNPHLPKAATATLPPQARTLRQLSQQKALLETLLSVVSEVEALIAAGLEAGAMPGQEEAQEGPSANAPTAQQATLALRDAKLVVERHRQELHDVLSPKGLPESMSSGWPLLATPAMQASLLSSAEAIRGIADSITAVMGPREGGAREGREGRLPLPGWQKLSVLLRQALELANVIRSTASGPMPGSSPKEGGSMAAFSELFEKVVAEALVFAQKLSQTAGGEERQQQEQPGREESGAPQEDGGEVEDGWSAEETLQAWEERFIVQMDSLRLARICSSTRDLISLAARLAERQESRADLEKVQAMLGRLQPLLEMLRAAGLRVLADQAGFSKAVAKLGYVLANLFAGVFREGFCGAKEEAGQEGATSFEDAAGTGMGAGEGQKDVSDQIENEDQLLGNKGEEEEEEKTGEKKKGEEEKVKGVEMEDDFEGDMFDLSEDEQEGGEEEQEGEEKEERLDEKMGEAGRAQPGCCVGSVLCDIRMGIS
jgi:hypothetical protein